MVEAVVADLVALEKQQVEKSGKTAAFLTLKEDMAATEDEIIAFCRENLAHYKCPKTVVFSILPKTSTGKVQKFILRDQAAAL